MCLIQRNANLLQTSRKKIARTIFTCLHFQTFDCFIFPCVNSNVLHSIHLLCILFFFVIDLFSNVFLIWVIDFFQTFDYFTFVKTFLISCWLHYVNIFASHLATDYMSNWFTFGSPRCSKNKPGLKMFPVLYYEKCIRSITGLKADQK